MEIKVILETKEIPSLDINECDLCVFSSYEMCASKHCGINEYFVITEIEEMGEE